MSLRVADPESFLLKVILEKMKTSKDSKVTNVSYDTDLHKFKS
jgi:hypothetical protein